jgi:thioredoxin reductase
VAGEIFEHAEVTAIRAVDSGFRVETTACTTTARRVVLAIGRRGTPRRLGVPGSRAAAHRLRDDRSRAARRRGYRLVGGGDSAVEIALALADQPGISVTLVHRGDDFGRCKPENQLAIDLAHAEGRLAVSFGTTVRAVTPERLELATPGGPRAVTPSLIVCCLGADLPSRWLRGLGIALRELRGESLLNPNLTRQF